MARNPKDVLVSYFHFHKVANMLETPKDFDDFFEKFLRGDGKSGSLLLLFTKMTVAAPNVVAVVTPCAIVHCSVWLQLV